MPKMVSVEAPVRELHPARIDPFAVVVQVGSNAGLPAGCVAATKISYFPQVEAVPYGSGGSGRSYLRLGVSHLAASIERLSALCISSGVAVGHGGGCRVAIVHARAPANAAGAKP